MEIAVFDLDRVLFDTNAYMKEIKRRMREKGIDPEKIFREAVRNGRKDLSTIYKAVSRICDPEELLFSGVEKFVPENVRQMVKKIREKFDIAVVSVGDGLQKRKLKVLNVRKVVLVRSDDEKIEIVREIMPVVFVDDKREIVERAREEGINAFQAVWFLDRNFRRRAMGDALQSPEEVLEVMGWRK